MSLSPGTRIGVYEVAMLVGEGGMGQVYRARDTRLDRDVALKVLPEALASDLERIARFEREAKTLAALNHPHIAQIFGFEESGGVRALVMEYVDGPTLADRIADGALPLEEALPIATQIAEALEAAHEQGIIHRDLKPANIKVRDDGTVKVLDFGLAKAMEPTGAEASPTTSPSLLPTMTSPALMTGAGMLLGTAAYMSPEQAKGRPADKRSDVWAFGAVLYEMLTGVRAFSGDDMVDVLGAVARLEPDWTKLPATTPTAITLLVQQCLTKDRKIRLGDIAGALFVLRSSLGTASGATSQQGSTVRTRGAAGLWLGWVTAAGFAAIAAYAWQGDRGPSPVPRSLRFELSLPEISIGQRGPGIVDLQLSPDGQALALCRNSTLVVRRLDTTELRVFQGTDDCAYPFWSPDNVSVAFFTPDKLKRVDLATGAVTTIADVEQGRGGSWGAAGVIVFSPTRSSALMRIPATGGSPQAVTTLGEDYSHRFPWFLPDGRHFLYMATAVANTAQAVMRVGDLDSTDTRELGPGDYTVAYSAGYLLYLREGTLTRRPFDLTSLTFTGDPAPLVDGISRRTANSYAEFSVSAEGTLAYLPDTFVGMRRLDVVDRNGRTIRTLDESSGVLGVALSPDGSQAAIEVSTNGSTTETDLWIYEVERDERRRLTNQRGVEGAPVWSPDGRRLSYSGGTSGQRQLYVHAVDGTAERGVLLTDGDDATPTSWALDGRLFFNSFGLSTGIRAVQVPAVQSGSEARSEPVIEAPAVNFSMATASRDGRALAFVSNASGRAEVYVAPTQSLEGRRQVSSSGAGLPRWSADGRELFFLSNGTLRTAGIRWADDRLVATAPTDLRIRVQAGTFGVRGVQWDVFPRGDRFLVVQPNQAQPRPPLTLVTNWPVALGAR